METDHHKVHRDFVFQVRAVLLFRITKWKEVKLERRSGSWFCFYNATMTKNISFSSHFLELACIDWSSLSTLTLSAEMSASGELAIASHRSNQVKKVDSSFSSLRKSEIGNKVLRNYHTWKLNLSEVGEFNSNHNKHHSVGCLFLGVNVQKLLWYLCMSLPMCLDLCHV